MGREPEQVQGEYIDRRTQVEVDVRCPPGHFESGILAQARGSTWQPNSRACAHCCRAFNFAFRRRHCRRCGLCVCASCSPYRMFLESPVSRPRTQIAVVRLFKGRQQPSCQRVPETEEEEPSHESPSQLFLSQSFFEILDSSVKSEQAGVYRVCSS